MFRNFYSILFFLFLLVFQMQNALALSCSKEAWESEPTKILYSSSLSTLLVGVFCLIVIYSIRNYLRKTSRWIIAISTFFLLVILTQFGYSQFFLKKALCVVSGKEYVKTCAKPIDTERKNYVRKEEWKNNKILQRA